MLFPIAPALNTVSYVGEGPSRLYRPLLPSCNTHRVPARSPSRVGAREGGQHMQHPVRTATHTRPELDTAGCERPESGGEASEVLGRSWGCRRVRTTHNADECRSKLRPRRKFRAQSKIWGRGCRGSASSPSGTSRNGGCTGCARQPKLQTGLRPGTRLPLPRLPRRRRCSHGGRVAGAGCAKKGEAWKGDGPKGEEVGACARPKGLVVWVARVTRPKGLAVWAPGSSLPKGCVLRGASCRVWRETPPRRLRWVRRRREG